jgi:hypothetical protein
VLVSDFIAADPDPSDLADAVDQLSAVRQRLH